MVIIIHIKHRKEISKIYPGLSTEKGSPTIRLSFCSLVLNCIFLLLVSSTNRQRRRDWYPARKRWLTCRTAVIRKEKFSTIWEEVLALILDFPIFAIHFNISLSSKQGDREKWASLRRLFLSNCTPGWALFKIINLSLSSFLSSFVSPIMPIVYSEFSLGNAPMFFFFFCSDTCPQSLSETRENTGQSQ